MERPLDKGSGCVLGILGTIAVVALGICLVPMIGMGIIAVIVHESLPSQDERATSVVTSYYNAVIAHDWTTALIHLDTLPTASPNASPSHTTNTIETYWTQQEATHSRLIAFTIKNVTVDKQATSASASASLFWKDGTTEIRALSLRPKSGYITTWAITPGP